MLTTEQRSPEHAPARHAPIRVLIVDDHSLICDMMSAALSTERDFDLVTVASVEAGLEKITQNGRFDVVLLDYEIPGVSGLEGLLSMIEANNGSVALFSGVIGQLLIEQALSAGASGFIPKTLPLSTLRHAIGIIADGEVFLPASFAIRSMISRDQVSDLKPREMNVLALVGQGQQNKEIARILGLSETIVKLDVKSICRKLGVNNRTRVVIEATRRGLL
jgi:DNA-binding NarL/FixJ family response regulator